VLKVGGTYSVPFPMAAFDSSGVEPSGSLSDSLMLPGRFLWQTMLMKGGEQVVSQCVIVMWGVCGRCLHYLHVKYSVAGKQKKLSNEFHNLYSSTSKVVKLRMRWRDM
jgi:hypothetical protein